MNCDIRLVDSLCKVFPDEAPCTAPQPLSALLSDVASFQVAIRPEIDLGTWVRVRIVSALRPWLCARAVCLMPSSYPAHKRRDANYLRTTPGMFPDRLAKLGTGDTFRLVPDQWRALWVELRTDADTPVGTHPITIEFISMDDDSVLASLQTEIMVIGATLPAADIYHSEWFHADCLADYYGISTDSDAFFDCVAPFLRTAVQRGINTILTPLFTPPLDTAEGGERTTVQLVGVTVDESGAYVFDFSRFRKWISLCDSCGVQTFEMSHLFTQWGAKYAPKIMGLKNGRLQQLFGWDTPGTGDAYAAFLAQFLPALRAEIATLGIESRCLFHISDEPALAQLESYSQAKALVKAHLSGFPQVDALSNFEFYQSGAVDVPIVANDHIEPFLAAGVENLWTYYCTAQSVDVSNRFFAMPSARNRVLGLQLYLYRIKGFLHWGYNFYNTQFSLAKINPYAITDAGEAFPSGDAFLVYPGDDGQPEESIRIMVLQEAFSDLRALSLLESLAGRTYVEGLVRSIAGEITFSRYPQEAEVLLTLRQRINDEIAQRT